jgi:hypothetical protein
MRLQFSREYQPGITGGMKGLNSHASRTQQASARVRENTAKRMVSLVIPAVHFTTCRRKRKLSIEEMNEYDMYADVAEIVIDKTLGSSF